MAEQGDEYFRSIGLDPDEQQAAIQQARKSGRCARTSGVCLCLSFVLVMFGVLTPYWLVHYNFVYASSTSRGKTSLGTGAFMMSSSSSNIKCSLDAICVVQSQWNPFDQFNNTICAQPFYDQVGQFGFCDGGENGQFQVPSTIVHIQYLSIAAACLILVSSIAAMCAPVVGSKCMGWSSGLAGISGSACACAAFSLAATYSWYSSLAKGGNLPLVTENLDCNGGPCLFITQGVEMNYGPAFICMVMGFIIALLSSIGVCLEAKNIRALDSANEDVEAFGDYGSGASDASHDDPSAPLAYKYVYEDAPQAT